MFAGRSEFKHGTSIRDSSQPERYPILRLSPLFSY
jgi:hypothetical protein